MSIIKKKYFNNPESQDFKPELDEFVDAEGGVIGGDRNVVSNSEIETGPVQKPFNDDSDYEKGTSTTTDRAARYKQNIPWYANYSARGMSRPRISEVITKKQMEEKVEDLVKKGKKDNDLVGKKDLTKIEKLISKIQNDEFTDEELKKLIAAAEDFIQIKNI